MTILHMSSKVVQIKDKVIKDESKKIFYYWYFCHIRIVNY